MAKLSTKPFLNRGVVCNYSLARRAKIYKTFFETLMYAQKRIFPDHRAKNVPETSSKTSLPWLNFKTGHFALRRDENIIQILEGRFRYQNFSSFHSKETEHSFELSLSICVF